MRDVLENIPESTCKKIKAVYVPPKQYEISAKILRQKHLLIVSGPAHIGKTALGQHLLIQLKDATSIDKILSISRPYHKSKLQKLKLLQGYGIFIDDLFGKSKFEYPEAAEDFADIINLSKSNFVVITSRNDILDEAFKSTIEIDETYLKGYIFELKEHESYKEDELKLILERHLDYSFNIEGGITKTEYDLARLNQQTIVSALRFPHNIERLVSLYLKGVVNIEELNISIDRAKEIKNAAGNWFERLQEEGKYFVFAVALFNERFEEKNFRPILRDMFSALGIDRVPRLGQLRKETKSHITEEGKIAFKHQDYLEGILERIRREDYIYYKDDLLNLSDFLKSRVENENSYVRLSSTFPIGELAHVDLEKALSLTTKLLQDDNSRVRECAIFPLKEIAKVNYAKVSELINQLSVSGTPVQKQQIAFLFKEIGYERLNEATRILERLVNESETVVWRAAAYALGTIGKEIPNRILPIINDLVSEKSSRLGQAAAICVREIGKIKFSEEIISIIRKLILNRFRDVESETLRALRDISYARPKETIDLAVQWSRDSEPRYRRAAAWILGEIGMVIDRDKATSILESLTKDEISFVSFSAKHYLKKSKPQKIYTFQVLKTEMESLVNMDRETISQILPDLKARSFGRDFNRALRETFILPCIVNNDAVSLKDNLNSLLPSVSKYHLLGTALRTIYGIYQRDKEKAISFILEWYEIDKRSVIISFYNNIRTVDSKRIRQFIGVCCKEISKKSGCDELFDCFDLWMPVGRRSTRLKEYFARSLIIILKEIATIFMEPVISLLQKWAQTGETYRLNLVTSTLLEIAGFGQDKADQFLRKLLDEGDEITQRTIFRVLFIVGEKEPRKVLPVLKSLASHNKLIIRQNVSLVLGAIGKSDPETTLNALRGWIDDKKLVNFKAIPHALQNIFRNNKSHEVLVALERWKESKDERVHQIIAETYKKLEREITRDELDKKMKEARDEVLREKLKLREVTGSPRQLEQILEFIINYRGSYKEGLQIDLKEKLTKPTEKLAKTMSSFNNTYGGWIIVGIDDNNNLIGLSPEEVKDTVEKLSNVSRDKVVPPLSAETLTIFPHTYNGKEIVAVAVKKGLARMDKKEGRFYKRTSHGIYPLKSPEEVKKLLETHSSNKGYK